MEFDLTLIILEYAKGKSPAEIAAAVGNNTHPIEIRRILKKNGIRLRGRSEAQKNALDTGRKEHPTEGKERPPETREKISKTLKRNIDPAI